MTRRYTISVLAVAAVALFASYLSIAQAAPFQFTATPTWVAPGQEVRLTVVAPDQSCSAENFDGGEIGYDGGVALVYPTVTTTYRVRCGTTTQSVRVTVTPDGPPPPTTANISANPSTVERGRNAILTWSSNGTSCTGTNFSTGGAPSGSVTITPLQVTNYTVTCTGPAGNANRNVTVYVIEPQFDASCSVNDTEVYVGEEVTWSAEARNGTPPYFYTWRGQIVEGLTGTTARVSYNTPGEKSAIIDVTDSASLGGGVQATTIDNRRCTGPALTENLLPNLAEDGGTEDNMERVLKYYMSEVFQGRTYNAYYDTSDQIPQDILVNPQNYCVEGKLVQRENPDWFTFGSGDTPFEFVLTVHATPGYRTLQPGDWDPLVRGGNPQTTWQPARYYGVATGVTATAQPRRVSRSCNTTVTVSAPDAPTASLTANPPSIVRGNPSTLTSTCTNATSATIDQGVGTVSPSGQTQRQVSPTGNTTYTLTCTGPGGTATSSVTVAVTDPPITGGSCSATPSPATVNQNVTWSVTGFTGGTGIYTYSWTGSDGLTGTTQSVNKPYTTPGTKTAQVTITSGTQMRSIVCAALTVNNLPSVQPDLTVGNVGNVSATVGTPVTLSATVANGPAAATGAGFTNLFQIDANADHSSVTAERTDTSPALAANGTDSTQASYTFPTAGTWYLRACADQRYTGDASGTITESNEGNNCSPSWTAITVSDTPSTDLSCTVNGGSTRISVNIGDTVTYRVTGGSSPYTWTSTSGGSYGTGSQANRTFGDSGTYDMRVSKSGFTTGNCPLVDVNGAFPVCTNDSATITATPNRVRAGETSEIRWSATGVDSSCIISGPGLSRNIAGLGCVVPNASANPVINTQSVYRIVCDEGESEDEVVVNVIPKFEEF